MHRQVEALECGLLGGEMPLSSGRPRHSSRRVQCVREAGAVITYKEGPSNPPVHHIRGLICTMAQPRHGPRVSYLHHSTGRSPLRLAMLAD